MSPDFLGLIVAAIIAGVGALLVMLREAKARAERLQKEKDVSNIKTESKANVDQTSSSDLLTKLNSKIESDRQKRGN